MNLTVKIIDPDSDAIVSLGHLQFYGNESTLNVKLQIINLDQKSLPYYIPASSVVSITFPGLVEKTGYQLGDMV